MEDISINVLVDAKNEYMLQLTNTITPHLYTGTLNKIYNKAAKQCDPDEDITLIFKQLLKEVPKWNQDVIADITKYVIDKSQCDWLDDLLTAVFISNARILTAVRTQTPKNKRLNLTIPTTEHFIHHCYIEVAREMYKNPYLFATEDMSNSDRHRNLRDTLELIKECIEQAVRKLLPVQTILKQYLGHLHDDDDISIVSEKASIPEEFKKTVDLSDLDEDSNENSDNNFDDISDDDDDIDLITVDDDDDDDDLLSDLKSDKNTTDQSDVESSQFDVDSVVTEESGDDFSDHIPTPPTTPTKAVEIKEVNTKDMLDTPVSPLNDVVVEKSNSVVGTEHPTTPTHHRLTTPPLRSVSPPVIFPKQPTPPPQPTTPVQPVTPLIRSVTASVVPTSILQTQTLPKLPVPPLSKRVGLDMMESPPLKQETVSIERHEEEIKVITDGRQTVTDSKETVEEPVKVEIKKPKSPIPLTPPTTPVLRVPEPHTPVKVESKESKEERRRRKKERRIRELRERGIVVRKPLRKDMKKKLKNLKSLKTIPSEFDTKPVKPFIDRPSTPPTPQRETTTLNTRPVFFNDAETRMSDVSDNE